MALIVSVRNAIEMPTTLCALLAMVCNPRNSNPPDWCASQGIAGFEISQQGLPNAWLGTADALELTMAYTPKGTMIWSGKPTEQPPPWGPHSGPARTNKSGANQLACNLKYLAFGLTLGFNYFSNYFWTPKNLGDGGAMAPERPPRASSNWR